MKSEYRSLVESIICCEQKLKEAKSLQRDAKEKLAKADGFVAYQEASLREKEQKLAELEGASKDPANPELQVLIKEVNASLKFLCRELMKPEA